MIFDFKLESKRLKFKTTSEDNSNEISVLIEEIKALKCGFFGPGFLIKENLENPYNTIEKNDFISNAVILSIYFKLTGEFIGLCGLKTDSKNLKGKLFYVLLSQYQGNGYAIESIKILLKLAFSRLNLNQVIAKIPYNFKDAWKPAERAGMRYMGDIGDVDQDSRFLLFVIDKKEYLNQVYY